MGSKTKKSKVSASTRGMSPGQSMAMAGNTGLAGATTEQALQIQKGLQNFGQDSSFRAIGQNIGEMGSKYRRPADVANYADKMRMMNEALEKGGKLFVGPDGIQRVNLMGTGVKDAQGQGFLSIMVPELKATAPTLGQLGGDISRGITGYNTLEYTDPQKNQVSMVEKGGLADALAKVAIPGSMAFNLLKDVYGKGKNLLLPQEVQEDIFSGAADATGGAFVLPGSLVPQNIEREDIPAVDKRARLKELIERDVAPGSSELNVDAMTDREVDLRLQSYGEPLAIGGRVGFAEGGGYEPLKYSDFELYKEATYWMGEPIFSLIDDPEAGGFTGEQVIEMIKESKGMKKGGLVPPTSGPQSEGIESLFKNK